MLTIKKNNIISFNNSLIFFFQLYKLTSLFMVNSLKKKDI